MISLQSLQPGVQCLGCSTSTLPTSSLFCKAGRCCLRSNRYCFQNAGIDLSTFDTDEENATLADILTYHVLGDVASSAVTDGLTVTMLNGDDASFTVSGGSVMINDATITTADVTASNGVIHIDTVLLPPADLATGVAQSTGVHTALVAALSQANLVSTLQGEGPFTVFAPTDTAFQDAGIDLTTTTQMRKSLSLIS